MSIVIQTNVASLQAQFSLARTQATLGKSFERLSSGLRINSAADDGAGLAISTRMDFAIRSSHVAERNANEAVSMAQTADGAIGDIVSMLGRMRELAVQSANGSYTTADRGAMQTEFTQIQEEISRIQSVTKYNSKALINATTSSIAFQVGTGTTVSDKITVQFGGATLTAVRGSSSVVSTQSGALSSLGNIDTALATLSNIRSTFGAAINRFSVATSNLQTARINIAASASRIRDVDVAEETSAMTRSQVMQQAGAAILSQANAAPQLAMMLLR